jgi:hypothetical protein
MSDISLSSVVRISEAAVFREIDGEAVVLNLATGMYYGLNSVGTRAWQLMEEHGTLASVCKALVNEFDVTSADAAVDLTDLVQTLQSKGLVDVL